METALRSEREPPPPVSTAGAIRKGVAFLAVALCFLAASCVPTDEIIWMGFSANDRYLACATRQGHLRVFDLKERKSREISDKAADGGFQWSPRGARLVFCVRREGRWDIALADPWGKVTYLTNDKWRDSQPSWSPDGRGIYYASSRNGGYHGDYDIRYYDLARRESFPIVSGPHDQTDPRISPSGRKLAAVSYRQGNPVLLIYSVRTMRVIQIAPPQPFRGYRMRLLLWLADDRHLVCEFREDDCSHLALCDMESEEWKTIASSDHPFASVVAERDGKGIIYITGGRGYRCRLEPRLGRCRRLDFDDLPVTRVAVRHTDDRLAVAVAGTLLGSASSSGRGVKPLLGVAKEYFFWGDLELQRGRKRLALRYYETGLEMVRESAGPRADRQEAEMKLARAALLCREGYPRESAAYLEDTEQILGDFVDDETLGRICTIRAMNDFIWNGRFDSARKWIEKIPAQKRSDDEPCSPGLILRAIAHPDPCVREYCRRGIAAFWKGKFEKGGEIFHRLLERRPSDPVVRALWRCAWSKQFALPVEDVFEMPRDKERRRRALARMALRYQAAVGDNKQMTRRWFETLAGALLTLDDADGLRRLALRCGPKFLTRADIVSIYRGYWRLGDLENRPTGKTQAALEAVLFDPKIIAFAHKEAPDPPARTDIRLAEARYALVAGDMDAMGSLLSAIAKDLCHLSEERVFAGDGERKAAYYILRGERAEREGRWAEAVGLYRRASSVLHEILECAERQKKEKDRSLRKRLEPLLRETRFRADLLQKGASVRGELADLLTIERGVGDDLMTHSNDPVSLENGISNYFALLSRTGTRWLKDLIYLKAGQCYRRLGRWGEAAFCLRAASRSRQRFVALRARAELAALFGDLEDPGLARWYMPH